MSARNSAQGCNSPWSYQLMMRYAFLLAVRWSASGKECVVCCQPAAVCPTSRSLSGCKSCEVARLFVSCGKHPLRRIRCHVKKSTYVTKPRVSWLHVSSALCNYDLDRWARLTWNKPHHREGCIQTTVVNVYFHLCVVVLCHRLCGLLTFKCTNSQLPMSMCSMHDYYRVERSFCLLLLTHSDLFWPEGIGSGNS